MVQVHLNYREKYDKYYDDLLAHPLIDRQFHVAQLGQIKKTLKRRGSRRPLVHAHSRFDHIVNAAYNAEILYLQTVGRCPLRWEIIPTTLIHDDGHPGYGHAAQGVLMDLEYERTGDSRNHNARGIEANARVKDRFGRTVNDILESMGATTGIVTKNLQEWKTDSEEERQGYGILRHPFFSPEKAEYLLADATHTGFYNKPPEWEEYCGAITIGEKGPGIDISAGPWDVEQILKVMQNFHPQAWGQIYYSRESFAAQRSFERALELGIRSQSLDIDKVWWWVDFEMEQFLDGLETSCKEAYLEYRRYAERKFFERGILFTLTPGESYGNDMEMLITEEISNNQQKAISSSIGKTTGRTIMENKAREEFGIEMRVMVTPEPHKFEPQDVRVYNGPKYLGMVLERDTSHANHLRHVGQKHYRAEILFEPGQIPDKHKRKEIAQWFLEEAKKSKKAT